MTKPQGFLPRFSIYLSSSSSFPTETPGMSERLVRLKPTIRNAINRLFSVIIRVQEFAVFPLALPA